MTSRTQFAKTLAAALVAQGFHDATPEIAREILDAWCLGIRGLLLPHGIIGAWAGKILGDLDSESPGRIEKLTKR